MTILPPCPTEDANWCFWDAATRGNGQGHSFITLFDTPLYNPMEFLPVPLEPAPFIFASVTLIALTVILRLRAIAIREGK